MPRISAFYGIVIRMYHKDHPPPHFHATYADQTAKVAIETGEVIAGSLPPRQLRLVRRWMAQHTSELYLNWRRAMARGGLSTIEPLP